MATSNLNSAMLQQFQGLLGTGKGSDLTITCRGTEFEVHKVVLFTQSGYFDKLLCGPFKEANQSTIDLIQVLVRYLYKHVLDLSSRPDTVDASAFVVHIYRAADYYDVPSLRTLALEHLRRECDPANDEEDFIEALRVHLAFKSHRTAELRTSISVVRIEGSFAKCLDITIFVKKNC